MRKSFQFTSRVTEGAEEYSVRGDCYVHGIMDGEASDAFDESERKLQAIVLV